MGGRGGGGIYGKRIEFFETQSTNNEGKNCKISLRRVCLLKVTNNDVGIKEKTRLLKLLYTVKGKNEQDIIW